MPVVVFLLDAMRHDYISAETTPFLYRCAQEGTYYKKVVPSLGFCERTEILSGLLPDESGFLTAIGYDPENSPFKSVKFLRLFEWLETCIPRCILLSGMRAPLRLKLYFRAIVARFFRMILKVRMNSYCIPFSLLPYFSLTEDGNDSFGKRVLSGQSILNLLDNKKQLYFNHSFTGLDLPPNGVDTDRISMALSTADKEDYALYLIYISAPDFYGHKYGPFSPELKKAIQNMDVQLENFVMKFDQKVDDCTYVFLGDHGMIPVNQLFNAKKNISEMALNLGLKLNKDYLYFLDSTLVRFWFLSEKAKQLLPVAIKQLDQFNDNGMFIDKKIAEKTHIPWKDSRYGDLIWWAHPGVLIFPDFFHDGGEPCKGMHGYNPEFNGSQGTCIVYGKNTKRKKIDEIPLTDVFKILKKKLKI